ncbi:MAG: translocation/assembly module TamB domain-containing protein [Oceanicaulis sp.]
MSEQSPTRPRRRRWIARPLAWLSGLATLLVVLLAVALVLVTGPLGRDFVQDRLQGQQIAGYGALQVGEIDGNIIAAFEIDTLALKDESGVWLTAQEVDVEWNVWALLTRRIEVEAVAARRVEILRRPERVEQQGGGGSFNFDIELSSFDIAALHLEAGVAGPEAAYSISSGFRRVAGELSGRLQAERLDAPGDVIDARFDYGEAINVDARIEAAPDGPLARLLRAGGQGASAVVEVRGGFDQGAGEALVEIGGDEAVRVSADWTARRLTADGRVRPDRWPQFEALQAWLGGPARFTLEAPLAGGLEDPLVQEAELRLDAPQLSATLSPDPARDRALEARVQAAPGGRLAALLRAGEQGAVIEFDARGGLDAGAADGALMVGEAQALRFSAQWTPQALTADGRVQPGRWPQFEQLQTWLGGPADFDARVQLGGRLTEPRLEGARLRLDGPQARVSVEPLQGGEFEVDARLDAPPGGPLAEVLRAGDQGASAVLEARGSLEAATASGTMDIGGVDAVRFSAQWTSETLEAEGRVEPARWPQFEQLGTYLGGAAEFSLALPLGGSITEPQLAGATLNLDAPQARITLEPTPSDTYALDARIEAAPGSRLSQLLRAGEQGASAVVSVQGGLERGEGRARVDVDGADALRFTTNWTPQRLSADGEVRPSRWPQFEQLQTFLGGPADFTLDLPLAGGLSDPQLEDAVVTLDAPEASLIVRPRSGEVIAVEGRAGAGLVSAVTGGSVSARELRVTDATVDLSGASWRFSGDVAVQGLDLPGEYAFERVSGPLTVAGPAGRLRIQGDLATQGARFDNAVVADLLGDAPRIDASLTYASGARRLVIERADIEAAAGPVGASGTVAVGEERFDVTLSSDAFDVSTLTDQLSGRGAVDVSAQGAFNATVAFQAEASGFEPAGGLEDPLSGPISAEVDGRRTAEGGLEFDRLQVQSPDLVVDATGAQAGEQFDLQGEAVYSGESPVAGISLAGTLQAAFEARYGPEGVDARIDANAGQVGAGPVEVSGARLRAEISGPLDQLAGEARLTGDSPRGPVDLGADFAREGERLQLTGLNGRAGGLTVDGSADVAPGAISADLDIAPVEGFGSLSLQARLQDGELDVTASAEDLIAGDMSYFDRFDFTVQGPLENARFSLIADGAYGAPFEVNAEGRIQLAGGPVEARASLEGEYGRIPIASIEPITVSASDPLSAQARLSVGEGRMSLSYRGGEAQRVTARLQDVPAAILSLRRAREPVNGALSGELAFSRAGGVWTGQAVLQGDDLRPADVDLENALDGAVTLDLNRERVELGVRADGPDFTALADGVIRTGPVRGPGDLTAASNPVSAQVDVSGRIGPFAAFHLASGQRLSGDVRIEAQVSGTVGDPDLVGEAALVDARFSDSRAGLVLQDLVMRAQFTQSRAQITELTATDGEGGDLSGGGSVEFAGGLSARAQAEFDSFQVVDRDDVSAVASGDVAFDLADGEGTITGAATIERAEVSPPDSGRSAIPTLEVTEINVPAGVREPDAGDDAGGPSIALDYAVSAPRRIFARGSNFDTEWGLEVQVAGTVADPEVYGAARVVRGRADLLGRVFDIESGVVRLSGDPRDATLQLTAVREERDITARIVVEGPVTSPAIDLRSSPSLPQDEVASRILFGEGAANLSGLQAAQLAASLASLSGGGGFDPLGALRQASGLDQLGVRRDAGGGTVVSGGRYLTEDVYLELESAGSSAAPSTNIEWELTRRFTLLSRLSADGAAGIALSWRTEYDDDPFGGGDLFDFDRLNFFGFGSGDDDEEDEALDGEVDGVTVPQAPRDPDDGVTTLPRRGG